MLASGCISISKTRISIHRNAFFSSLSQSQACNPAALVGLLTWCPASHASIWLSTALWGHSWCRVSHRYSPKVLWDPPGFSALSFCSRNATSWLPVGFFGNSEWNAARYPCYTGREKIGRQGIYEKSPTSPSSAVRPCSLRFWHCLSVLGRKKIHLVFPQNCFISFILWKRKWILNASRVAAFLIYELCISAIFKAREIETSLCFVRVNHFIKETKRFLNVLTTPGRHLLITQSLVAAVFCSE